MEYMLVVSDMDGTLLRDNKTISQRTRTAISRFEAAGGRFTVATGRNIDASTLHTRSLGLRTPMLLLNGCQGYDAATDTDLFCLGLGLAEMEAVWPILMAHGLDAVVHGPRRGITRAITANVAEHLGHDGITVDERPDLCPANAGAVVKILTIGDPAALDATEAAIGRVGANVLLVRSHPRYLEVLPARGGKGTGLISLAEHLGIPLARTIAIGDYMNDYEMLQVAGLGVAVANAHPELKRIADRLTASNEEDGVAMVLEAILEGRSVGIAKIA